MIHDARPAETAAIRAQLFRQLFGWPNAYCRRLAPWIRGLHDDERFTNNAARTLERFEVARNGEPGEFGPSGCACGCFGGNEALARRLAEVRRRAVWLREAKQPANRARQRELVDETKTSVLTYLWCAGQRKIDRVALGQHAVDAAKHELETLADRIDGDQKQIAYLRERLRDGVYIGNGRKKGQPLSRRTREDFERGIENSKASITKNTARMEALGAMLRDDVPALVREFTGCARTLAEREAA
jgi:hypothetical protein